MKKYILKVQWILILLAFGCADDNLKPIVTFEQLTTGGYPRLVTLTSGEFDLKDISGSSFIYEVEFVTVDKGANVTAYDVNVGLNGSEPVAFKSFSQSDFVASTGGFQSISLDIPFTEAAGAVGVDPNTLQPGDFFTFDTKVSLSDGNSYNFDNSTAAVNGSAFAGFFRPRVNVTCPLDDSWYSGTYAVSYVNVADAANCFNGAPTLTDNIPNVTLGLVDGSTTQRTLTPEGGNLPWGFPGFAYVDLGSVDFVCSTVELITGFGLNGSCGGSIDLTSAGPSIIDPDLSNDTSFTLDLNEFSNGECGCPEINFQLLFTKI